MDNELEIPDAAYEAADRVMRDWHAASDVLYAAAPLVVAAELRRLADDIAGRVSADDNVTEFHVNQVCAAKLRARADELDGA
jgi:hypothetical protein